MFKDIQQNSRFLNQVTAHNQEALAIILNPNTALKDMGRNLDYCIETHIHGDVCLTNDVDSFYVDASLQETPFVKQAEMLSCKYGISLNWIAPRQLILDEIREFFRGAKIPILAQRIDSIFGNKSGIINAALIGEASRDSVLNPKKWSDIGTSTELFQYFKQLWHTVAFFG